MGKYGTVAVQATQLMQSRRYDSPVQAWEAAAREVFPGQTASQAKSCPEERVPRAL
jgi:hypothetical protein